MHQANSLPMHFTNQVFHFMFPFRKQLRPFVFVICRWEEKNIFHRHFCSCEASSSTQSGKIRIPYILRHTIDMHARRAAFNGRSTFKESTEEDIVQCFIGATSLCCKVCNPGSNIFSTVPQDAICPLTFLFSP